MAATFIGTFAVTQAMLSLVRKASERRIVINAVALGYGKIDLTGHTGFITPEEGVHLAVCYALSGERSGRFVEPYGETPW